MRTVCSVSAAGTTIIASMAMTSSGLRRGGGEGLRMRLGGVGEERLNEGGAGGLAGFGCAYEEKGFAGGFGEEGGGEGFGDVLRGHEVDGEADGIRGG